MSVEGCRWPIRTVGPMTAVDHAALLTGVKYILFPWQGLRRFQSSGKAADPEHQQSIKLSEPSRPSAVDLDMPYWTGQLRYRQQGVLVTFARDTHPTHSAGDRKPTDFGPCISSCQFRKKLHDMTFLLSLFFCG